MRDVDDASDGGDQVGAGRYNLPGTLGLPGLVIGDFGGDEIAAGQVTIKDLDAGRAAAAAITDNEAWKAKRPGQVTLPRAELVAAIRRIIE